MKIKVNETSFGSSILHNHTYAWFPLDRNGIVKSCDSNKFKLTARRFVRIYDRNLRGCKSEPISVRFLFSILINVFTINQNQFESHDFTIPLRSNGNQTLQYILQGIMINVSKTENTKSFSKTQFMVHRTE